VAARILPVVHAASILKIILPSIRKKYSLYPTNIGTAIVLVMRSAYIIYTRYCDARIESILLEVNKKEVIGSLW
jgi:hypothetical protein